MIILYVNIETFLSVLDERASEEQPEIYSSVSNFETCELGIRNAIYALHSFAFLYWHEVVFSQSSVLPENTNSFTTHCNQLCASLMLKVHAVVPRGPFDDITL